MVAPCGYSAICLMSETSQPVVVLSAHRISDLSQHARRSRPECEQVRHDQASEAPIVSEAHASPESRIVTRRIGCRGV